MPKSTRRNFIQKNILGGIAYTLGIPLLHASSTINQNQRSFKFEINKKEYKNIDWKQVRQQFLFPEDKNYLNTASLGPSPKMVLNKVYETMEQLEVSCAHGHHLTEETHHQIAKFLNSTPDEVAIIRNATEGMNIAARSLRLKAGDEVLITTHEHVGGASPWLALQKDIGIVVKLIDLDLNGEKNLQLIKDNITDKTKVVAFSHITCTTGMKLPAKDIVNLCRSKGIYSIVDGAQALGMFPIDLSDMNPDFYTTSGHKWLFGPKGTGVLFMNKNIVNNYDPVFAGAYTDSEYDLNSLTIAYRKSAQREEYGTRNTSITLGLGSAINFIESIGIKNVEKRGRELSNYLRKGLSEISEIEILTPENENYSASMLSFRVKDKDNLKLNQQINKEYKIRLRGIYENNLNAIRVSFSVFNTFKELDDLLVALKKLSMKG
jgi:selenocysteine lyase/cysteine desulfurase